MGRMRIIVPSSLNRTQIRRKFSREYPSKVVTGLSVADTYKGKKGVIVDYRKRKR